MFDTDKVDRDIELFIIEKYSSGISRIKKFCKEHGIEEPKFQYGYTRNGRKMAKTVER